MILLRAQRMEDERVINTVSSSQVKSISAVNTLSSEFTNTSSPDYSSLLFLSVEVRSSLLWHCGKKKIGECTTSLQHTAARDSQSGRLYLRFNE